MKYLLMLNKFDLSKEILKEKIKSKLNDARFQEESGLILETNQDVNEILYFEELEKILPLHKEWQKLDFKKFKNDFENLSIKTYFIKVKFLNKIPISSKSIIKKANSALKGNYSENPEKYIYIEFI